MALQPITRSTWPLADKTDAAEVWRQLRKVEDRLIELSQRLEQRLHCDAQQLDSIAMGLGTTVLIPHKLGRAAVGWVVTDITADATVHVDTASTADLSLYLPLQASAACIIGLLVW